MKITGSEANELKTLVGELLDGQITDERRQRFAELLRHDADARDYYAAAVSLHVQLLWRYETAPQAEMERVATGAVDPGQLDFLALLEKTPDTAGLAPTERIKTAWRRRPSAFLPERHRISILAISGILTAIFFAVFAAFAFWGMSPERVANEIPADDALPAERVARLTRAFVPVWREPCTGWAEGRELRAGDGLVLASGLAEVVFEAGTRVVLEGPVEFRLEDSNRGRLELGRLVAQVPKEAIGFAVETPTVTITDLGTEFGVDVDTQGAVDVNVFAGLVEVGLSEMAGTPSPRRPVVMQSGEYSRFVRGQRIGSSPTSARRSFVRELPPNMALAAGDAIVAAINFGEPSRVRGWNEVRSPEADPIALSDALGRDTGWSLRLDVVDRFQTVNVNGPARLQAPAADLFPATVAQSSLYGNIQSFSRGAYPLAKIHLEGLNAEANYRLVFFAGRMEAATPGDNRETLFTAIGAKVARGTLNAAENNSKTVELTNVVPDATGRIELQVTAGPENTNRYGFYYLNGMIVAEVKPSTKSHDEKTSDRTPFSATKP